MRENSKSNNKKQTKHNKSFKKILYTFAFTVVMVLALVLGYGYHTLSSVNHENLEDKDLGIQQESFTENDGIINILLMGIDSRGNDFTGRSDAMMVLTIDPVHNKLKLTSLMRDSYVEIEGFGYDKLTHAYAYGEGYLSVKTVNTNFGLNIEDYVVVDFSGLETMIDQLGGLSITLTEEEISPLNKNIEEQSRLQGKAAEYIYEPGSHHMNGLQAVAYARIRKTSGGDYHRTERQRDVLEKMLYKLKDADITTFASLVKNMLPYVKTSLGSSEIISLGTKVFTSDINTIEQKRFPLDDYSYGGFANNRWHLMYDVEPTREQIYDYIFQDIAPEEGAVN